MFRKRLPGWWGKHPRASRAFSFFFLGFAVLWTIISFVGTYTEYASISSAAASGRTKVVEGTVTSFKPMPASGAITLTGRDRRELLTEREDLQVKDGPASEEADDGGQHAKEDGSHPTDRILRHQQKSIESICTGFLVGTGSIR